jgi:hypothetical protein
MRWHEYCGGAIRMRLFGISRCCLLPSCSTFSSNSGDDTLLGNVVAICPSARLPTRQTGNSDSLGFLRQRRPLPIFQPLPVKWRPSRIWRFASISAIRSGRKKRHKIDIIYERKKRMFKIKFRRPCPKFCPRSQNRCRFDDSFRRENSCEIFVRLPRLGKLRA